MAQHGTLLLPDVTFPIAEASLAWILTSKPCMLWLASFPTSELEGKTRRTCHKVLEDQAKPWQNAAMHLGPPKRLGMS